MELKHIKSNFQDQDVIKYDDRIYTLSMLNETIEQGLNKSVQFKLTNGSISIIVVEEFRKLLQQENILSCRGDQTVFDQSLDCEILSTEGGGWKKGKIRFRYVAEIVLDEEEVISSEPESPLDDIRQSIQEQTEK